MRGIRQTAMLLGVCAALGAWVQGATREDIDAAVARITKGVTDDTGRARKLLEAVQTLELQRDLVVGILDRAVECATQAASDPDAFQAGLDALDELERKAPDRKAQWAQKRVALSRRAYEQAPADKKHAAAGTLMKMLDARGDRRTAGGVHHQAAVLRHDVRGLVHRPHDRRHEQGAAPDQTGRDLEADEPAPEVRFRRTQRVRPPIEDDEVAVLVPE